ncbi:MAG: HD-GYP domain-containing protein [Pseudomonadota bacterium]
MRLLMAWLPLSLLIGFAVWHFETGRLEERVLADAIHDARQLTPDDLKRYYRQETTLLDLHQVAKRILDQFVSVEIYDKSGQEIVQEINERASLVTAKLWARAEATKLTSEPFYDQSTHGGRMTIITVVPVRDGSEIIGSLKGIYVVPDPVMSEMQEDSMGAILVAVGSVMASLLVVFPIILYMQREHASQTRRVIEGNLSLLEVLGNAVAFRDSDTDSHNYRVTIYALRLAEKLGISVNQIRILIVGAFVHDVGKIGITDSILLKPGKLTAEEFAIMKTHVSIGADIVRRSPWLSEAVSVVEFHHEKYDGSGYPTGLVGENIPLEARIFAVADVFDALTTRRPYKEPFSLEQALDIMRQSSGTHFDPIVFRGFEAIAHELYTEIAEAPHDRMRSIMQALVHRYLAE